MPRRLAICSALLIHDPRLERTSMLWGCLVEHCSHHLVATEGYGAWAVSFTRLIPGAGQPKHRIDGFGLAEAESEKVIGVLVKGIEPTASEALGIHLYDDFPWHADQV